MSILSLLRRYCYHNQCVPCSSPANTYINVEACAVISSLSISPLSTLSTRFDTKSFREDLLAKRLRKVSSVQDLRGSDSPLPRYLSSCIPCMLITNLHCKWEKKFRKCNDKWKSTKIVCYSNKEEMVENQLRPKVRFP